jgi:hypothetical protein
MRNLAIASVLALGTSLLAQGPTCSSSLIGLGCGAQLTVTFTPQGGAGNHTIEVAGTGMHPDSFGLMVWGQTPVNIPLGGGCTLWTEFAWGHLINVDSLGEWSWSRTWPAWALGYFDIQLGSFLFDPTFEVRVSNAERAVCQ